MWQNMDDPISDCHQHRVSLDSLATCRVDQCAKGGVRVLMDDTT
jgi:hypothetical protein